MRLALLCTRITTCCCSLSQAFLASNATSVSHVGINVDEMPSAFSAIALSFAGHACFPSLESGMADPLAFPRVLDWSFIALLGMCECNAADALSAAVLRCARS